MSTFIRILVVAIVWHLPIANAADDPRDKDAVFQRSWKAIKGDWIRKDFVQDVQKHRSVYAVIKAAGGMDFYSAGRKTLTFSFEPLMDEVGYSIIRRAKQCSINALSRQGDKILLDLEDKGDFCADFPKHIRRIGKAMPAKEIEIDNAAYVRDTEDWLARALIAGKYQDGQGDRFEFGTNGHFQWPDRSGKYSLANENFKGLESDYFIVSGQGATSAELFCFRWDGTNLLIRTAETKKVDKDVHEAIRCSDTVLYRLSKAQ